MSVIAAYSKTASPTVVSGLLTPEHQRTLLIVDDEDGPLQALQIIFAPDYSVILAHGGSEALEIVGIRSVDAVVLDIRMPDMSGIEVLKRIKEIDPSIEVIMLTAYETLETARQALRLGARDYLTKPFEISTMRQAVATAMECKYISQKIQYHESELKILQEEVQNQSLRERIARTRGEIYASILHDVNGPLTVISAFVEIMNNTVGGASRVEGTALEILKDQLYRITVQVDNCISISRRYLSFLRESPGTSTPISVNQTLKDVRQLLKARPDCRTKDLKIQFLSNDVTVGVNGTDLVQVILNLAVNAFQCSTKPTSVLIAADYLLRPLKRSECEDVPGTRLVDWETFQNMPPILELSVRDSGPGIPFDIIDRIFDPFFSTKPAGHGTGLGLAIVRRLVSQSNGCIQLRTNPSKGTEFKIYLPAREILSDADTRDSGVNR